MPERVTVRVPATTANLGPGFDCLGMALDIWNEVAVERGDFAVAIQGEGEGTLSTGQDNLVYRALCIPFQEAGLQVPTLSLWCSNTIPLSRGLGSSAAAIVGGLVVGNQLAGSPLDQEQLLEQATLLEGHPDNVSAALLGGCRIVVREGERLITAPVPLPEGIGAVLFVPETPMPTREARAVLDPSVSREDAVYNIGRGALLVNALATGRMEDLRVATQDRLHQPARQALFPAMKNIFRAALDAGALGVFLSGGGSTVLALTRGREMTIGYEMAEAAKLSSVNGEVKVTRPSLQGAHVVGAG